MNQHDAAPEGDMDLERVMELIALPERSPIIDPGAGIPLDRWTVLGMAANYHRHRSDGWFECRRLRLGNRGTARALRQVLVQLAEDGLIESGRSFYGRRRWRVPPAIAKLVPQALSVLRERESGRRSSSRCGSFGTKSLRVPPVTG